MRSRYGRRAFRASPIRCVGERIKATGVPEFREVAWRACIPAIGLILPAFLLPTIQIGLLLACVVGFDVRRAYNGSRDKWKNLKNDIQGIRFADYLKPLQKKTLIKE